MAGLEQRWYSDQPPAWYLRIVERLYKILAKRDQQRKLARQWCAPVPVILVGNITVGGTGKTPLVAWLVEFLRDAGYKPGIVSRGFKAKPPHLPWVVSPDDSSAVSGDEPLMLAKRCQCPLVIDPQRVSAAQHLLEQFDCDVIISDDGLQHLALGRDIELVVLDGARGLGNGHCLPAGPLRESAQRLQTVDFVISNGQPKRPLPRHDLTMTLTPQCFRTLEGEALPLDRYHGQRAHAVAGIGNPQRFFDTLNTLEIEVEPHIFADHHAYRAEDLQFVPSLPLLTTEKDAVKWQMLNVPDAAWLEIKACLPEQFGQALLEKLTRIAQQKV